uniref:Uncharacterized protein n=1 Tax=Mola mola TaxID=94237 RepID=A0A3Q3XH89_MOLML
MNRPFNFSTFQGYSNALVHKHHPALMNFAAHLQQLLLHRVPDQVRSRSPGPAAQVVGGDGERGLGGVQCLLQPGLQRQQRVRVGLQPVDVPLQLGLPAVDLLQSLPKKTRSVGLRAQRVRLAVPLQGPGLPLDDAVVVGEPLGRGVFSGAREHSILWAVGGDHCLPQACGRLVSSADVLQVVLVLRVVGTNEGH